MADKQSLIKSVTGLLRVIVVVCMGSDIDKVLSTGMFLWQKFYCKYTARVANKILV